MKTCDQWRELIWDELYELLEPDESLALSEHVRGCTACGAELAKAKAEQKLIAEAARLEIAVPPFVPPSGESTSLVVQTAPSARRRIDWSGRWPWLAAAAVVLLAIGLS